MELKRLLDLHVPLSVLALEETNLEKLKRQARGYITAENAELLCRRQVYLANKNLLQYRECLLE